MFLFSCLLCLTSFLGVMSQSLTQSSSEVKKPGESVKISCKASGYTYSDYYMYWVQQVPGKGLEWIGRIYPGNGNTKYSSSYQGRFTITSDTSINTAYLQIDNVKVEDTATYYCTRDRGGIWVGYTYIDVWGPGTPVTVTAASPSAPFLFPLISCGTSQEQTTAIGCLARNFLPESIAFDWKDKTNTSFSEGVKKYTPVLQLQSGNYITTSQAQVLTNRWENSEPFYCTAKHTQGDKTVLLQKPNGGSRKPIITIHPPMIEDIEANKNATIVCIVSGFYPSSIEMKWQKNHNGPLQAITEGPVSDENGGFIITSYIVVSQAEWDSETFSCIVNHSASDVYEIKNISKSSVCESSGPGEIKVTVMPPLFETIFMQNNAPLTCIISNMEQKDGLEVSWYSSNEKLNTEIEDPVYDTSSRKYIAKAIATVCPEDWKTKTFECRVTHPDLPNVVVVTLTKPNDYSKAPTVLLFPPHQDELAKKEAATLVCLVKGFSPPDIFVKWMDSDNVEQSNVVTTKPMEEITSSSKKTYILYSTLTLTNIEEWNNGKPYTCIVGHDSLPLHTTQRTIDKSSGKPTNMNVSLIMSDTC